MIRKELSTARRYIFTLAVLFTLVVAASLVYNLNHANEEHIGNALNTARTLNRSILATRKWNYDIGGTYAKVSDMLKPNPFHQDPDRDIRLPGGSLLTMINSYYMERLISEYLRDYGIQYHITSLNPIRPENGPDDWERAAIKRFAKGSLEEFSVVGSGASTLFRYMAPLKTEKSCLKCHGKQGYKEGEVRGGFGISLSYLPYEKAIALEKRLIYIVHAGWLLAGMAVLLFLGWKLLAIIDKLHLSLQHIRKLEGILPICASCKKIRLEKTEPAEQKSWIAIDTYISDRTDAMFSHGICPECMNKLYGEK